MTKKEAIQLGNQLGITVKNADDLYDRVDELGYRLAVDNRNGDWVVLDKNDSAVARLA